MKWKEEYGREGREWNGRKRIEGKEDSGRRKRI